MQVMRQRDGRRDETGDLLSRAVFLQHVTTLFVEKNRKGRISLFSICEGTKT